MRYTMSPDGVERVSVRLTLRFTRQQIALIRRLAKDANTDWRGWLDGIASLGIEGELDSVDPDRTVEH